MTRTKQCISFVLGATLVLAFALLLELSISLEGRDVPSSSDATFYSVGRTDRMAPLQVVKVDAEIQFSFSGDPNISPGSLVEMTRKMHDSEVEIASALAREIEIPPAR